MASIGIAEVMKALRTERADTRKHLAKLDRAIRVLRDLGHNSAGASNGRRRKMSASARRKIGQAQRARWRKLRQKGQK
jgi:hypothetical protein